MRPHIYSKEAGVGKKKKNVQYVRLKNTISPFNKMLGEVTAISGRRNSVWVMWENGRVHEYRKDELEFLDGPKLPAA